MAVYSKQFGIQSAVGAGTYTIYTAPSGSTSIIRDIELSDASGSGCEALVTGPGGVILMSALAVPANGTQQWKGRVVMDTGDTIKLIVVTHTVTVVASGYALI